MLGVGEGRVGSGRGGEGRGGQGCGGSPQLSLLNVPGGPRTITIDFLQFPYALISQTSKGPPVWRVIAGCMRDILYETDYMLEPHYHPWEIVTCVANIVCYSRTKVTMF